MNYTVDVLEKGEYLAKICSPSVVAGKGGLGEAPDIPQNVRRQLRAVRFSRAFLRSSGLSIWQDLWKNRAQKIVCRSRLPDKSRPAGPKFRGAGVCRTPRKSSRANLAVSFFR